MDHRRPDRHRTDRRRRADAVRGRQRRQRRRHRQVAGRAGQRVQPPGVQQVRALRGQPAARARGRRPGRLVQVGHPVAGRQRRRRLPQHLAADLADQPFAEPAAPRGGVPPQPGQRRAGSTGEPAQRRHPQRPRVEPVAPPGRVLVDLRAEVDRDLFAHLLQPFAAGLLRELLEAGAGGLLHRPFSGLLDRRLHGLLGQRRDQLPEDLLDDEPARRHRGRGCRRRRAEREDHRHGQRDQLDDEDADLDPDLDLGALDVAAALLDELAQLVRHGQQQDQRRLVAVGQPPPRLVERAADHARRAVPGEHLAGGGIRVVARGDQRRGGGEPRVRQIPDRLLVTLGPLDADDPLQALVRPAGQVPGKQVERVRDRAGQHRHGYTCPSRCPAAVSVSTVDETEVTTAEPSPST